MQSYEDAMQALTRLLTSRCLSVSSSLSLWRTCTRLRGVRAEAVIVNLDRVNSKPWYAVEQTSALCKALCECLCPQTAKGLSIRGATITGPSFALLARHFRSLIWLDISLSCGITDASFAEIKGLPLRSLCLTCCFKPGVSCYRQALVQAKPTLSANAIKDVLSSYTCLAKFEMESHDVPCGDESERSGDRDGILMGLMNSADALTDINLHKASGFSVDAVKRLAGACARLECLDLGGGCAGARGAVDALATCAASNLRKLCLDWVKGIEDDALAQAVKRCPNLTFLNVHADGLWQGPGVGTLQALAGACPELRHLDYRRGVVSDYALCNLASGCPLLRHLDVKLCSGSISDATVRTLFQRCEQLAFLNVSCFFSITPACYDGVVCLAMQTLICDRTGLFDDHGYAAEVQRQRHAAELRRLLLAFPNLRCLFYGPSFEEHLPALERDGMRHQLQFSIYMKGYDNQVERQGIVEAPMKCLCCNAAWVRNGYSDACRLFRDP